MDQTSQKKGLTVDFRILTNSKCRTCSEICIEVDNNSNDLKKLFELWAEVVRNRKQYPLVELLFMQEYFEEKAKVIARQKAELFKEWIKFLEE